MPFYHNTNIEIQIGDFIKIAEPFRKCKYKKMVHKIIDVSKSGKSVWYSDNRTNNKCDCGRCIKLKLNNTICLPIEELNNTICLPIEEVKLHMKVQEKEREIKLKQLLKEDWK